MKTSIRNIFGLLTICCCLCAPVQAQLESHDSGLGKSQDEKDHNQLGSVAVAPEPSTFLIYLLGSLGLAAAHRRKSTKRR